MPKNVIIFVGDGMGYNTVDAASMYEHGQSRYQVETTDEVGVRSLGGTPSQVYEHFPYQFAMTTYLDGGEYDPQSAWTDFDYVIGSPDDSPDFVWTAEGSAETAMSTGVRTDRGAIGVNVDGKPLTHLGERARALGKATGVVDTYSLDRPTPAAWIAHQDCSGEDRRVEPLPACTNEKQRGIAEEIIADSDVNVIMSFGHPYYDNNGNEKVEPDGSRMPLELFDKVRAGETKYTFVGERSDFQAFADGDTPQYVMGIGQLAATNVHRLQTGPPPAWQPYTQPYTLPRLDHLPTLEEMTLATLNILDNASNSGLFAVIGGSGAFTANRRGSIGHLIEEQIDFNKAVEAAVDWVEENSNWSETLMVVTANHDSGYLVGPGSDPEWKPMVNHGPGLAPGAAYAAWGFHVQGITVAPVPAGVMFRANTNALVPLYAKGARAERFTTYVDGHDPVRGPYIDNTAVAQVPFGPLN